MAPVDKADWSQGRFVTRPIRHKADSSQGRGRMATAAAVRADARAATRWWWVFIVTGAIWFMASLVVLRFDTRSVTTIGIIIGVVFTIGALNEFMVVGAVSGGWKIVHVFLGVVF